MVAAGLGLRAQAPHARPEPNPPPKRGADALLPERASQRNKKRPPPAPPGALAACRPGRWGGPPRTETPGGGGGASARSARICACALRAGCCLLGWRGVSRGVGVRTCGKRKCPNGGGLPSGHAPPLPPSPMSLPPPLPPLTCSRCMKASTASGLNGTFWGAAAGAVWWRLAARGENAGCGGKAQGARPRQGCVCRIGWAAHDWAALGALPMRPPAGDAPPSTNQTAAASRGPRASGPHLEQRHHHRRARAGLAREGCHLPGPRPRDAAGEENVRGLPGVVGGREAPRGG